MLVSYPRRLADNNIMCSPHISNDILKHYRSHDFRLILSSRYLSSYLFMSQSRKCFLSRKRQATFCKWSFLHWLFTALYITKREALTQLAERRLQYAFAHKYYFQHMLFHPTMTADLLTPKCNAFTSVPYSVVKLLKSRWWNSTTFPPLPFPAHFPCPSIHSPPFPFFIPLRSRPLKSSYGVWGRDESSLSWVLGRAPAKIEYGAFKP